MKTLSITTTYDEATRLLTTNATLTGFVPALPATEITAVQVDTVTLFTTSVMAASDAQAITASQAKALLTCNKELASWAAAALNKDKADLLPDAPVEPEPVIPA